MSKKINKYGATVGSGHYCWSKDRKAYNAWFGLLERCYEPKYHLKKPTYIGCTVDERWMDFQVFAEWFYKNYPDVDFKVELDKDLIKIDNKVYGSDYCSYIPATINSLFNKGGVSKKNNSNLPLGISIRSDSGNYKAKVSDHEYGIYLSKTYKNLDDAVLFYNKNKARIILRKAEQYKYMLNINVYNNLIKIAEGLIK